MIVLFTTPQHGAPFIREVTTFAARHDVACEVVLSSKREPYPPGLRQLVHRGFMTTWMGVRFQVRLRFVRDVNDPRVFNRWRGKHGLIASFDHIFKHPVISVFASLSNIHASILPYLRGPDPIGMCVAAGEPLTGFTLHEVTEQVDRGPIFFQGVVPIGDCPDEIAAARRMGRFASLVVEPYLNHVVFGTPFKRFETNAAAIYEVPKSYAPVTRA